MHKCVACQRNYQVYWHPWQAARMDLPLFARPLFGPRSVALIIVHRILMYLQGRQHTKQYVMIFCTGHRLRDGSMLAEDCRVVFLKNFFRHLVCLSFSKFNGWSTRDGDMVQVHEKWLSSLGIWCPWPSYRELRVTCKNKWFRLL